MKEGKLVSDKDFVIIDEDEKEEVKPEVEVVDKEETSPKVNDEKDNDDEYEKYCMICHRPESITGKMIELPGGICVCPDCMQRSFDAMTNGSIDYSKMMDKMPGVSFMDMSDLENMIPKQQKVKKKKEKT